VAAKTKGRSRQAISRTKRRGAHTLLRGSRVRESLEQFRLAQETLGIVTWVWDTATDRVQWYGDASRLLGLPTGAFSGSFQEYLKRLHGDDVASARALFIECLKGTQPEYRSQERLVWPDGSIHWVETYGRASYGPDGRALRMTGVVKDITERKQQESARARAEKQLARVFDASPDYIVIVRADDGAFIAANPAFEKVTGYRAEEIVGRTVADLKIWGIPGERERFLADLQKTGTVQDRPVLLRRRDGNVVSGKMSASLVEHNGERLVISMMHDVTAVKQLERRARQSESKFAALFEHSPEAITLYRLSDGVRLEANAAWERMTGYSRKEVAGRPARQVTLFKDKEQRERILARVEGEGSISNVDARLVRADGAEFDALLSAVRIDLESEQCVLWCWRDVSRERETERRARQSERKFTAVFDTNPTALIVTRPRERRIVEANDAALRLARLARDEMIGARVADVVQVLDEHQMDNMRARALAGEHVSELASFRRRDGTVFEAMLSGAMIEVDREPHLVVALLDLTEQKRIERAQRDADARYRALFESALEAIFIASGDDVIIDVNPAAAAMTGYPREELLGMHAIRLYSEAELKARPFREGKTPRWGVLERTLTRKDGGEVAVEVIGGPMPDGNVLAIMRDITERKRNDTLLMHIARGVSAEVGGAFFRSLAEHLARELGSDFAFIGELIPPENTRMRTLAFLADGKIAPNPDYLIAGSMSEKAFAGRATVAYPQGVTRLFPDNREMKKSGVEGYVGTPLFGANGEPIGVLAVAHRKPIERSQFWASMIEIFGARAGAEIERARAEALVRRTNESLEQTVHERTAELEEANRELESYSYSISHDLRQPLNAISGFADLLREQTSALDPAGREFLGEIESNTVRMEQMIESLLRLSRAGRGALRKSEVDARALVDAVLHDLSVNGPLGAEVALGPLPPAPGDAVLLRQVWANLIGNALKYSRKSATPRIEIGGARHDGMVEYTVRDNGVGFDMRHAERLFNAFQRLPTAAGFEGTGVGLAIVERIVRRHGGAIRADSTPGQGARFRFTLPDKGMT